MSRSICNHGALRDHISVSYEKKLEKPANSTIRKTQGYNQDEIEQLPEDVTNTTFGCGNPFAFIEVQPGETVVDLGSGSGLDVILAANRTGPNGRVIGVDMTDKMVQQAKKNIQNANLDGFAEVRRGLIESLPIESNSADWVISNCVLSLSPVKEQVFKEVFRVLKPGGKMLISDIVVDGIPPWTLRLAKIYSPSVNTVKSEQDYLDGLAAAGLENIAIKGRLVYDEYLLCGLLREEMPRHKSLSRALLDLDRPQVAANLLEPAVNSVAKAIAGKVASVKFYAEKPM